MNLVLVEHGEGIDDHPRERPAKVDDLVHEEAHETGRENVVLHPQIPRLSSNVSYPCSCLVPAFRGWVAGAAYRPELLGVAQLNIVLGNLLQDGKVCVCRAQASDGRITR